jgi:hypothetical protein
MRFSIRPGKVTCAGLVAILMVLPNSIWKGPDAKDAPVVRMKIQKVEKKNGAVRTPLRARKAPRSTSLSGD